VTELERAIRSQPGELRRVAGLDVGEAADRLAGCSRVWLVGTGTSWHAAELGAAMLSRAGVDAHGVASMEFARRAPVRDGDGLIVISHTGETAYARAARAAALEAGAPLVSITAEGVGWPEAIEAGPRERSETYTASYTAALGVLALLAGLQPGALVEAAGAVEAALEAPGIEDVPEPERLLVLVGAGPCAVTAREGALKLREAARVAAEGYDAEYLLHGSAVPLDGRDALVAVGGDEDGLVAGLAGAARAEGVAVASLGDDSLSDPLLAQIPLTARLQLLALRRAEAGGHDPDTVITGAWAAKPLWETGAP